jgi:hypothetical protein
VPTQRLCIELEYLHRPPPPEGSGSCLTHFWISGAKLRRATLVITVWARENAQLNGGAKEETAKYTRGVPRHNVTFMVHSNAGTETCSESGFGCSIWPSALASKLDTGVIPNTQSAIWSIRIGSRVQTPDCVSGEGYFSIILETSSNVREVDRVWVTWLLGLLAALLPLSLRS